MGVENARVKCDKVLNSGLALEKFKEMIKAQGGDLKFLNKEHLLDAKSVVDVKAQEDGYIDDIDPMGIAGCVMLLGGGRLKKTDEIDLYCGVETKVHIGDSVKKGDVIATIYSKEKNVAAENKVLEAIKIGQDIPSKPQMILAIQK